MSGVKIAVIDYGVGNIKSICNAFEKMGANINVTREKEDILGADGIVLPGVGAFPHGMKKLLSFGLDDVIRQYANTGKPLIGVCLGMQMLFDSSNEFQDTKGIGLIPGKVEKLPVLDDYLHKLPHVSWNEIEVIKGHSNNIISDVDGSDMYFVHSFYATPDSFENVLSTTNYSGFEFCSTVKKGNIYGCQYHPEKSSEQGLKVISNFIDICNSKG